MADTDPSRLSSRSRGTAGPSRPRSGATSVATVISGVYGPCWTRLARTAGGVLNALDRVAGERRAAFALVRPPGHHAEPARGMGFCLFNNAGIAARAYTAQTGRPAIVADFDYHHGNGTQALVGGGLSYLSTHAMPAYPGTGFASDNHAGADGTLPLIRFRFVLIMNDQLWTILPFAVDGIRCRLRLRRKSLINPSARLAA